MGQALVFSVIIPTRNRPAFLQEAVESVLRQAFQDFEMLIVNDGAESVQFNDARIKVLDNKQRGAVPARNFGVSQSQGTHIAFLDDDDVWIDTNHLARAFEQKADFYFADGFMKYANSEAKLFAKDATKQSLAHDNTILISAVCYNKRLHAMLGMFDETLPYYWDWDWYLRVARSDAVLHHCEIPAVDIRVHAQNMSANQNFAPRLSNLELLCAKHRLQGIELKNHTDFV
jgi:glycosyltransferase involved in cell wall biosynthesis